MMQGSPFLFNYILNVFSVFDVFFCFRLARVAD